MRAIFISYRRDDAEGHAGRLFEDLAEHFGKASVFMDVTGIEPGRDFRHAIEQQVASCGVLLAVIGKSWLTATDAEGRRRLDDPYDFVRLETVAALKRDIPVVPVLVHGAHMPRAEQLPDALTNLAFRNSVELTHARWSSDVQLLITALLPYVDAAPQPARLDRKVSSGAATGSDPASSAGATPGLASEHVARPKPEPAKKRPLFALAAALAIVAAFLGYFVSDWPHQANPSQTVATVAAPGNALPIRAREKPEVSGVARETAAPVAAPKPSAEAASAREPAARGEPGKSRADNKTANPIVAGASAARSASPHVGAKRPAVPEREVMVAAERPAADKVRAAQVVRAAPEVEKSVETKLEPAAPVAIVPVAPAAPAAPLVAVAPLKADNVTVAKVEPILGNSGIALLGSAALPASATRTIAIYPDTRYVNMTGGEIVKFTVGNQSFAWNFNGRPSSFDLNAVAPPGVLDHGVKAYVAPNPLYMNPRR